MIAVETQPHPAPAPAPAPAPLRRAPSPRPARAIPATPPSTPALSDADIRPLLRAFLAPSARRSAAPLFIEELGLCRGQARVDVAAVTTQIHGYEIKSDRDSLRRLAGQIDLYGLVLDRATLVVGDRHTDEALDLLPAWWGVLVVSSSAGREPSLRRLRPSGLNPQRDARALAELIWRDEALALLEARGASRGVRTAPREFVWDRLCEYYALPEIAASVRACLRARQARRETPPSPSPSP